ncbi:MAG: hypothetical protein QM586_12700 [Xenophilus sp.]
MSAAPAPLESAAFPTAVRTLAVIVLAGLVLFGLRLSPHLAQAQWTAAGLALFAAAALMVLWMGTWIVRSRTRLEGDTLSQTWLWTRRVEARDVASVKLVDIPGLRRLMAPRLLVRRRGGGMTWFHSANPQLLAAFCTRVAQHRMAGAGR